MGYGGAVKAGLNYAETSFGVCLTEHTKAQFIKINGTKHVQLFRKATQKDVDWAYSMGGYIPPAWRKKADK